MAFWIYPDDNIIPSSISIPAWFPPENKPADEVPVPSVPTKVTLLYVIPGPRIFSTRSSGVVDPSSGVTEILALPPGLKVLDGPGVLFMFV